MAGRAKYAVAIFPHSREEFPAGAPELANWLRNHLRGTGEYLVASIAPGYRKVGPGTLVLFQKDKLIVGEAIARVEYRPYAGSAISPVTGGRYPGLILFEPTSVRCYVPPLPLAVASRLTGKNLVPRFVQFLEWNQYGALLAALVKGGFS